ncbi:MAG TPA: hypothetical protein PKD21_00490, partial [Candidatus Competibacter phosphatis]|nr:hypothetical protein [Candidatus Competibacter phosphatis]
MLPSLWSPFPHRCRRLRICLLAVLVAIGAIFPVGGIAEPSPPTSVSTATPPPSDRAATFPDEASTHRRNDDAPSPNAAPRQSGLLAAVLHYAIWILGS